MPSSIYGATGEELIATIEDLLNIPCFYVEKRAVVQAALARLKASPIRKAGQVDVLIAAIAGSEGCTETVTFDKPTVRAAGMTLLV